MSLDYKHTELLSLFVRYFILLAFHTAYILRYFSSVFVSWKLMHSCAHFKSESSRPQIQSTLKLMKNFLSIADCDRLIKLVVEYNLIIPQLLPMFSVLFHPISQPRTLLPRLSVQLVTDLEVTATKVLLFHLQVVLSQPVGRRHLEEQKVDEYLVCLPWGLPPSTRPAAEKLVSFIHQVKPLPIPKLSTMVRSLMAHSYLEFDKLQKKLSGRAATSSSSSSSGIAQVGLPIYTTQDQLVYLISIQ